MAIADIRLPRCGDPVIVYGERGTIVHMNQGLVHIDADDDIRTIKNIDRLRWDPIGSVWIVLAPELPEPAWLHDDHPADATVESEYQR